EPFVARPDADRVEAVREDLAVARFVGYQRDNTVGRSTPKDEVGRSLKNFLKIEHGPERLAHLVEQLKDLRLSAQVLHFFRRSDGGLHRQMGLPSHYFIRGDLDLCVTERLVIAIDNLLLFDNCLVVPVIRWNRVGDMLQDLRPKLKRMLLEIRAP